MDSFTIFYGLKLNCDKETIREIIEHLVMNGYTFDTSGIYGDDTLFVYNEEIDYVMQILREHGCPDFETL